MDDGKLDPFSLAIDALIENIEDDNDDDNCNPGNVDKEEVGEDVVEAIMGIMDADIIVLLTMALVFVIILSFAVNILLSLILRRLTNKELLIIDENYHRFKKCRATCLLL